jgi:hypothetical protein
MASITPLTASGGTTPYTYSVTGTLPAGLSLNAATGAVTGTPTAVYAATNMLFSVKDVNNVVASTTSTVSFTVSAAGVLPAGYVAQGGLTWTPITLTTFYTWANANVYCTTTINGQTGWRLPTRTELVALRTSGALNGQGWLISYTWSSTVFAAAGYHYRVSLGIATDGGDTDLSSNLVTCVR